MEKKKTTETKKKTQSPAFKKPFNAVNLEVESVYVADVKVEEKFNIGEIIRSRLKLQARVYTHDDPKGMRYPCVIIPNLVIEKEIFDDEDEFRLPVVVFHEWASGADLLKLAVISAADEGLQKGEWKFFLHAANNSMVRTHGLHRVDINLAFKLS